MNAYSKNSYITGQGVIYERVIQQKINCQFYTKSHKHKCTLKSIEPDTGKNYRYTCFCDNKWKFCDINGD